jgi:hypothetical protein
MSTQLRNGVANCLGLASLVLAVEPIVYVFHADAYPRHALTEPLALAGAVGGASVLAFAAGIVGSRWWFAALIGPVLDVLVALLYSP